MSTTKEAKMIAGELCVALMRADTEDEVIALLRAAGYWDDPDMWRDLGDDDNNFATIGNQQSEAIAALIEKVINSVDARLMNACLTAGIDPTSADAPQSIREAVALFFEGNEVSSLGEKDGRVAHWNDSKTTSEGRLLTVAATGNAPEQGWPSITVADQGEGQTPDEFPNTFMSLHRANKLRIPFVQGKFNMGGTGVFQFCDTRHRLQLVVSRRNPALLPAGASVRDHEWGFTIVRRQGPADGRRSSVFTYLAPIGADPSRRGAVLSFSAETWPILPESDANVRDAYAREAPHGTLVKLYEYKWQGTKSNIIQSRDGLLRRLDQGLPELALPVRVFECRPGYRGGPGSFATNVLGLSARLERDRADNLEAGFPRGSVIDIEGKKVRAKVFAFKKGVAPEYRTTRNGVILSINGQAHASLPIDFFRRQSVGMSYLADSLLITVDCTGIEGEAREDLFMNSRDRLRDNVIAARLIDELESLVRDEPALRALRNRRREEDLAEKLSDSKPLANVLEDLVRRSPTLAKLFLKGARLPSPFPPGSAPGSGGSGNGNGTGTGGGFKGKAYPTYFRFKGLADGEDLERDAFLGSRVRVQFETDAENEYFVRDLFPGESTVWRVVDNAEQVPLANTRVDGPRSGIATLNLDMPNDVAAGSVLTVDVEVTDDMRIDPFVNRLVLRVHDAREGGGGGGRRGTRRGGEGGGGLALPEITPVREEDWDKYSFHTFNEESALVVVDAGAGNDSNEAADIFDFYVNVDNKYLRTVQKESPKEDPKLLEAKFTYSLVLVGLALIHDERAQRGAAANSFGDDRDRETTESLVARATSALAPVLLPMVETIGGLSLDDD